MPLTCRCTPFGPPTAPAVRPPRRRGGAGQGRFLAVSGRPRARARRLVEGLDGVDVHVEAHEPARIARHARVELPAHVLVADVVADGRFARLVHDFAALHVAVHRCTLDFGHGAGGARIAAVHLVADEAADDGTGRRAAVAAAARVAELVADHAAHDGAEHRAGADGRAGVRARDPPVFVAAHALVPAALARHGDAFDDRTRRDDAGAIAEALGEHRP